MIRFSSPTSRLPTLGPLSPRPLSRTASILLLALAAFGLSTPASAQNSNDPAPNAETLTPQCEAGDMVACFNLGFLYAVGDGVTQNYSAAARLFRIACTGGNIYGCSNLAFMYEDGRGVTQDDTQAARLYRIVCDHRQNVACNDLGVMYEEGRGVTRDLAEAARLYRIACEDRYSPACTALTRLTP